MKRKILLFLVLLLFSAPAYGVTPGKMYKSGERVSHLGISFQIPKGWGGGLPQGGEFMILGSDTKPGAVLVIVEPKVTMDQLVVALSSQLPLGDGVVLTPTQQATRKGKVVTSAYQMVAAEGAMPGEVAAISDGKGRAIGFFAFGPPGQEKQRKALLKKALSTVKFAKRPKPGSGKGARKLGGKKLMYMKTEHGLSQKKEIVLCSNGTAYWTAHSSSVSQLGTGVTNTTDEGTWWVQGGSLVIAWNKGGMREEPLSKGKPRIARQSHWFFVAQNRCK